MILVFGGAYQGKLDYVKENLAKEGSVICDCNSGCEPDFSADIIYGLEAFALKCVKEGREAREFFEENEALLGDQIFIATDTSQGVVPIDKDIRAFREMNGRMMLHLASKADRVIRVFCGIGKDIK